VAAAALVDCDEAAGWVLDPQPAAVATDTRTAHELAIRSIATE
jgi:hypothetical protein